MSVVSPVCPAAYERGNNDPHSFGPAAYALPGDDVGERGDCIVRGTRGPRLRGLTYRYQLKADAEGRPIYLGPAATNPSAVAPTLMRLLGHEAVEVFGLLCLTTRRRIICWHEVSRGCVDRVSVNVREVFIPALLANASAIVVAHNHPSGDPEPSDSDVELTGQLLEAGRLMGIAIVDHIIVGDTTFVSLACRGLHTPRERAACA